MGQKLFILLFSLFALLQRAQAYPSFIGYGYTSCIVCHFNAFGNGPLTDYGRALGATVISGKPIWNLSASDEELGEKSGFFFGPNPESIKKLHLSASYRGLYYKTGLQDSSKSASRWINMQGDASVAYEPIERKLLFLVSLGYYPPPPGDTSKLTSTQKSPVISREHYVSYAFTREVRLYLGMTDIIFGIRHPDHVLANRVIPGLSENDQVHGLSLHWAFSSAELGLHTFVGNLFEPNADIRQKGASGLFEFDLLEKVRAGTSVLYSTSNERSRFAWALHGRVGIGEGSALLGEAGLVRTSLIDQAPTWASYVWGQSTARLTRGLSILFTTQFYSKDTFHPGSRVFLAGPSIQYFPFARLELRADFWGTRTIGTQGSVPDDDYQLLGQVHLWF